MKHAFMDQQKLADIVNINSKRDAELDQKVMARAAHLAQKRGRKL